MADSKASRKENPVRQDCWSEKSGESVPVPSQSNGGNKAFEQCRY